MLGRQVRSSLLRLPLFARLSFQCQHDLTSRALLVSSQRFYATPGRPRRTVGEPSRPVKRAVKRAAKSSDGGAAAKKVSDKKKNARAKKPVAKKKKAAPKKKPVKKPLTETQKAAKEARLTRQRIVDLKKDALSPPSGTTVSAMNMFFREKMKGQSSSGRGGIGDQSRAIVAQWKEQEPADIEHYNHLAQQESEQRRADYKRWVESHTPEQIAAANRARAQLKRKLGIKNSSKYSPIKDERHVKRPLTAYLQFAVNRHASGDFRNISIPERSKLISREWKALNESEKKKYKDLEHDDRSRFNTEYVNVFGHEPPRAVAAAA